MKKQNFILLLALCLMLTGCGWLDGSYVSIEPHEEQEQNTQAEIISARNYLELMDALEGMISTGAESGVIYVPDYHSGSVDTGMDLAIRYAMTNYPIGDYAVEEIHYELGTSNGIPAAAVTIAYRHSLAELLRIHNARDMAAAEQTVARALADCDPGTVMLIRNYEYKDFAQMVSDYAQQYPEIVMETPQVAEMVYGTGDARVVELIFTYQSSRDSLRQMRTQVKPVFDAARLYVSGSGAQRQKFAQLYAFLLERFDYELETSITPAYSLLCHGVGDSRAFAAVYASMCRGAGLECLTVTGTRAGEPWTWNMVADNDKYYHVDLLRSNELGAYREFTDGEMKGYVWDYSAYPISADRPAPQEPAGELTLSETSEETAPTEETAVPETTTENFE